MSNQHAEAVFDALGEPVRRRILELLHDGPAAVGQLARRLPVGRPAVSKHLRVLSDAGLIEHERAGREVHYRVTPEPLSDAALWLNRYAKYWQGQFERLAQHLVDIEKERS